MSENLNKSVEEKPKLSQYFVKSENENGIIEIDENVKPTEILDYPYLYHVNKETENTFPYLIPNKRGKWMMFIKNEDIDQKWKDCCKFYDENKLSGIRYLTCSTGYRLTDPTYSEITSSAIFFHCGPASDRDKMLEFGKNLLKYIPYCADCGYMSYKSREQTEKNTQSIPYKSQDKSKNIQYTHFLYRITVPRHEEFEEELNGNRFFVFSEEETGRIDMPPIEVDKDIKPTEIQDYLYLYHQNINILNLYTDLYTNFTNLRGKWNMFFKDTEDFNEKWKHCCKLYQEGKLNGILSLKCSTGHEYPSRSDHVIFFYCGPETDEFKVLEYGKNLLKYIPYCSDFGYMTYKIKEQTEKGMQASYNRVLYRIPVPKHLPGGKNIRKNNKS